MTPAQQLTPWKPPRPKPELLPATAEQAQEYMSWLVNRRAYTRQKDNPDPETGKCFFYQARNFETKERMALDTETVRKHLTGEITISWSALPRVARGLCHLQRSRSGHPRPIATSP